MTIKIGLMPHRSTGDSYSPVKSQLDRWQDTMIRTKRFATVLMTAIGLILCGTENAFSVEGSDNLTRVRMGLAARSTTSMPFFVAKERGFFREEGLDVELIVMQAIQTIQATMGKSTQFASATACAISADVSDADIRCDT